MKERWKFFKVQFINLRLNVNLHPEFSQILPFLKVTLLSQKKRKQTKKRNKRQTST